MTTLPALITTLETLNNNYGFTGQVPPKEYAQRFASAFTTVMQGEPELTDGEFTRLLLQHRWTEQLFRLSGYGNSDHLVPTGTTGFQGPTLRRLLTHLCSNTQAKFSWEQLWDLSPILAAHACFARLMPRSALSQEEWDLKAHLLDLLPFEMAKRPDLQLDPLFLNNAPEVYMHCSYGQGPGKHSIKALIHQQFARAIPVPAGHPGLLAGGLPRRALVICENLSPGHAVWRTHARAVEGLKAEFTTWGLCYPPRKGDPAGELFDKMLEPKGTVGEMAQEIIDLAPDIILYLGVGMVAHVVALASLRLAPAQVVSFGHTASTFSPVMDYFILPEDFLPAPQPQGVFSERVIALAPSAMPMTPVQMPGRSPPEGRGGIAVPASIMKLNPQFLQVVSDICLSTGEKAHFFPLAARGVLFESLLAELRKYPGLTGAVAWPELPPELYLTKLASCKIFLSPFPYGNMNSLVECLRLGLPGVALDGPEAHSHADTGLLARVGLSFLSAESVDLYKRKAVNLLSDPLYYAMCSDLSEETLNAAFFHGKPGHFGQAIAGLAGK